MAAFLGDEERDVGDADHFAALNINDLLVEQIAYQPEHVLIVVVRREQFVAQVESVQRDRANLIVADGEPGPASPYQVAVHADGVDEGDQRGVLDAADAPALEVEDLQADELGQIKDILRHRKASVPSERPAPRPRAFFELAAGCAALYMMQSNSHYAAAGR